MIIIPYPSEYSCRLCSPIKGAPTRRKNGAREHNGKKYDVIYQEQKGKWVDQSYRYPKKTWSASEARSHCKSHKGSYRASVDIEKVDAMVVEWESKLKKASENEGGFLYRLSSKIFNTPLAITPDKLAVIMAVLNKRIGIEAELKALPEYNSPQRKVQTIENIALIPIHGTLMHRTYGLDAMSGLLSYEAIQSQIIAAAEDSKIDHILLDINSPGGEVSGVFDLADMIYALRDKKHIVAYANEHAYSAAYALASSAHEIYTSRTGGVGSIGVIAVHVDQSAYDEKQGLKYTSVYAGERKNDWSPHEPLAERAYDKLKAEVDEIYEIFVNTVSRNRELTTDEIKRTEADIYLGDKGVNVGLVDAIMTFDQVIDKLTNHQEGGNGMGQENINDLKDQLDALLADASPEERDVALLEMGYVPKATVVAPDESMNAAVEAIRVEKDKEIETLQANVSTLTERVTKAETDAAAERTARRRIELKSEIGSYGVIGNVEVFADVALKLEGLSVEDAGKYLHELKAQGDALKASGVLSEIGDAGEGIVSKESFLHDLKVKVAEITKEDGMTELKAWREVPRRYPELYKKYKEGR